MIYVAIDLCQNDYYHDQVPLNIQLSSPAGLKFSFHSIHNLLIDP